MSTTPTSPLRARMIQDMTVRNFVPDTQREYIRAVKKLAAFLGRSPDTATAEDLRTFQLHLTQTGANPPTINATVTALRFFFKVTVDRPETTRHLVFVFEPRKLPRVLPPEDILRLLEAAPNPKSKAALSVAYGAGLRAMEVVALKVADIDSQRMLIRVEMGKGRKDRHAMLSPQLLDPQADGLSSAGQRQNGIALGVQQPDVDVAGLIAHQRPESNAVDQVDGVVVGILAPVVIA